ncbi:hypothetical protein ACSSVY_004013 [Roseovarius sp. MBR-51]
MTFSKLKQHQIRIGAGIFADMFDAIAEICDHCSPDEFWKSFNTSE